MTLRRVLLALLVLVVALPLAALAAAQWLLTEDTLKLRVIEAVRRATGRELTILGPARLAWSLAPTVEMRDIALANPPGFSRPDLARLERLEARVALWPLLQRRVEIGGLTLVHPDVLLERDAAGRPNWVFARPEAPAPEAPTSEAPTSEAPALPGPAAARTDVVIRDILVQDAHVSYRGADVTVPSLAISAGTGAVQGSIAVNGTALAVTGTAGPVGGGQWPVDLHVAGGGLTAVVTGMAGPGGSLAAEVLAPDLAAVSGLVGRPLPPLRNVRLRLAAPDGPVQAGAEVLAGTLPVALAATTGSLAALLGGGPVPVQFSATAEGATLTGQGSIQGLTGRGIDLAVSARVADLRALGVRAGLALPPVRDLALDARLADAPGGVAVRGLRLNSSAGDVAGDVVVGYPRPSLRGSLVSQHLDLDAWAAAPLPQTPTAPVAPGPAPAPVRPDRVVPDTPLPFAALRRADADLHAAVNEAAWHGAAYRAIDARLLLQDSRLRLDPASLQGPGGPVQLQLLADAAAEPPTAALTAHAPGLAAGPVLAALGAGEGSGGTVDLDVQFRAAGATPRAMAATLDGHLGVALVDAEVENRWLATLFGDALRAANVPLDAGGRSRVRCLALRVDAAAGQAQVRALALDSTRLRLDGEGGVNLVTEALDLHLHPYLRLGGTGVSVPVRLGGTLRTPKPALDAGALAPGRVGVLIGGAAPADACGPALALARDGRAGPPPAAAEPPRPPKPADLLRSLLR